MEFIEYSRGGGKKDVVIAVFLSLFFHAVILLIIFQPSGRIRGNTGPITAAERLSHVEEYVFKDLQGLLSTYQNQATQIAGVLVNEKKDAWSMAAMPESLVATVKTAGVQVLGVQVWPTQTNQTDTDPAAAKTPPKERYTIAVRLQPAGPRVFNDILAISYAVGHATLSSDFSTDNLEITVDEPGGTERVQFIVPTMDCRLLYRNKVSPQEFLMGGSVRRGISG